VIIMELMGTRFLSLQFNSWISSSPSQFDYMNQRQARMPQVWISVRLWSLSFIIKLLPFPFLSAYIFVRYSCLWPVMTCSTVLNINRVVWTAANYFGTFLGYYLVHGQSLF
jgi:hypothetical protein